MKIEEIIKFISPGWAAQRAKNRLRVEASDAWRGSSRRKITFDGLSTSDGTADDNLRWDLQELRNRSGHLFRNDAVARAAINTKVVNVVGSGLRLQSQIEGDNSKYYESRIEEEFKLWSTRKYECDGRGQSNFYEIQSLLFQSILERGDSFVIFSYNKRKGNRYGLKLNLIEADRVSNPNGQADTDTLSMGIKYDKSGCAIGFWYSTSNRYGSVKKWTYQPFYAASGRQVALHLFDQSRIDQSRGIPDLAPVIELLKQLGDFTDAYLQKALVSAILSVFVKSESGQGMEGLSTLDQNKQATGRYKLGSGTVIQGMTDESVDIIESNTPNNSFDPFVVANLRSIGAALNLPYEVLVKHFTSSYTAAQAAFMEAWRYFRTLRRFLIDNFCTPVFNTWLDEAANIYIDLPGYSNGDILVKSRYQSCEWVGDPQGHIDPLKANKADELAEKNNWVSGSYNASLRGQDWRKVNLKRKSENQMTIGAGLILPLENNL